MNTSGLYTATEVPPRGGTRPTSPCRPGPLTRWLGHMTLRMANHVLILVVLFACGRMNGAELKSEANLPSSVDLRPAFEKWGLAGRQQGDRPTCSAFTMAGALEFAAAKQQGHGTRLSVEFLNWAANKAGGGAADGGFFSDLWKGFSACGICVEEDMPYQA